MTQGDELVVTIGGVDRGLSQLLSKIDAEMKVSAASAQAMGASYSRMAMASGDSAGALALMDAALGKVSANTASGTAASLASARAEASLAVATGDHAAAIAILEAELATQLVRTDAVIRAEIELTGIENTLVATNERLAASAAAAAAAQEEQRLASSGMSGAVSGASAAVGGLGIAMGGIIAAKFAADLVQAGAEAQRTGQRFESLAVSAHTTGAELLTALRSASGHEIADSALELDVMKASLLGVGSSAAQLAPLMTLARDRAQQMGITTEQAFERLVTGLGRGSAKIIDDLGIVVHITQVNDAYAKSIGKTAGALSDAEKKQALVNEVMRQGAATAASSGGAIDGNAASVQRLGASFTNLKEGIGSNLASAIAPAINSLSDLTQGFQGNATEVAATIQGYANFISILTSSSAAGAAQQESNKGMIASFLELIGVSSGVAPAVSAMAGAFDEDRSAIGAAQAAVALHSSAINDGTGAINTSTAALQAHAAEYAMLMGVTEQSVQVSMADAAAKEELTAKTGMLIAETNAAVSAFMLLHPNINAAGVASLVAAGKIDPLLAQLIQATLRAREAANALAAFNALQGVKGQTARQLIGADSEVSDIRHAKHEALIKDRNEGIKATSDAARAEENYQLTLKNTAPALAHARNELAQLTVGSAAYINKQNDIAKLEQQAENNAKKHKGAGAKLSDQTKLENSLLASQEKYQNKSEDAESKYLADVEKINADFYDKMLAAQQDFDQAQMDDRAGFYDQQGSIESDAVRKAASQQYEAASIEAGKIAQEKGADVANKYMDAQEQIINARAKRLDEIEKASNKKDKKTYDPDKAEYLTGVDKEYRKAEDAKLARIKEGGGSLADEKQKQLDDAAQKEQDALDKIGLASDRATEAKILGSTRAGKKIDEEGLKVDGLTTKYDKLGASGARAGITPAAPTAAPPAATGQPPTAPGTPSQAPAPADDPIVSAVNAMQAAIVSAVGKASDAIAGAVRASANGKLAS